MPGLARIMRPLPKVSSGLQSFCQAASARASVYQFCGAAGQASLVAYRQVQCLLAQRCYPHHKVHRGSHRCQIRCQGSFLRCGQRPSLVLLPSRAPDVCPPGSQSRACSLFTERCREAVAAGKIHLGLFGFSSALAGTARVQMHPTAYRCEHPKAGNASSSSRLQLPATSGPWGGTWSSHA